MKINFLTIFPRYYAAFQSESIVARALKRKLVEINVIDFRAFATNKHQKVDDQVYGGGAGMLLMVEPIDRALATIPRPTKIILLCPQGRRFDQRLANELKHETSLTFIAGRYEGFDERVRHLVDMELSIGDYVLTGGELASMVIADAIIRLVPGVIAADSYQNDSFQTGLLDYPQYTRPASYKGMAVPEVLLSGNHAQIRQWQQDQARANTRARRPDLLESSKEIDKHD